VGISTRLLRDTLAVVVSAGLIAAAGLRAESVPQDPTAASRIVLASVTDGRNHPLADLGPDDFVISENGQVRDVVAVYAADYPVVVLVDNSSDARSDLQAIRTAVTRFLSRVGQRLVALGTLANPPVMLTSLEDDRATMLTRLERLTVSPTTVLMPIEAVAGAAQKIREAGSPFSAIVVVSAHRIDSAQPQNTRLLPLIFESNAIVHVVSRGSPATMPRGRAYAPRLEADLLRDLADQTRGYFTTVFSAPSYAVALNNLADRLATEMMVEYLVPPEPLPPGEVQVGVKVPGAHVRGLGVSK
jgi:hypothetical protein